MSAIADRAGVSLRHLPGKHDQKKHAGGRGGSEVGTVDDGMPEGWSAVQDDPMGDGRGGDALTASRDGVTISYGVERFAHGPPGYTERSPEERRRIAEDAVVATARSIDPLLSAYPELRERIEVSVFLDIDGLGPSTAADTVGHRPNEWERDWSSDADPAGSAVIRVDPSLFAPRAGDEPQTYPGSVMGDRAQGSRAVGMATSVETGFHNRATAVDPVRSVVTHEMGHVMDWVRSSGPVYEAEFGEEHSADREAMNRLMQSGSTTSLPTYESASQYARSSAPEFYAEGFAEWHMRDVAEPSDAARWLAADQGWEGA